MSAIACTTSSTSQQGQSRLVGPQSYTKTDVAICAERLFLHVWSRTITLRHNQAKQKSIMNL